MSDLISVEEAVGKLRAAQRARQDRSLALIARTHAGVQSLPQVIQRTRAYQDAGSELQAGELVARYSRAEEHLGLTREHMGVIA